MQSLITINDLKLFDTAPRVLDVKLSEALGFGQDRDIRKLIKRNRAELSRHGGLRAMVARYRDSVGRNRPVEEFWLNEQQALLVCMFARTARAAEVRAEIIAVFMAWRETRPNPSCEARQIPSADGLDLGYEGELDTKLRMLEVCRRIYGRQAAQRLWPQLGLPSVDGSFVKTGGDLSGNPYPEQIGRFLSDRTVRSPGARVQSTELYEAFVKWCEDLGESVCTHKAFTMSMDVAGVRRKLSSLVWFIDIRLKPLSIIA